MDFVIGEVVTITHTEDEIPKILKGKVIQIDEDSIILRIKFMPFKKVIKNKDITEVIR